MKYFFLYVSNHINYKIMLPTIDGHFWVVRNGKILDTDFAEYSMIKKFHNLTGNMVYKEADDLTQTLMIIKFRRALNEVGLCEDDYVELKKGIYNGKVVANNCYYNSLLVMKEGDELKFGSMGWKKKNGDGIWWEYGGEDWKGIKAFLK